MTCHSDPGSSKQQWHKTGQYTKVETLGAMADEYGCKDKSLNVDGFLQYFQLNKTKEHIPRSSHSHRRNPSSNVSVDSRN